MTTFTTEDRIETEKLEPIPFAGLVDVDEELRLLRAENEELRTSGNNASNH